MRTGATAGGWNRRGGGGGGGTGKGGNWELAGRGIRNKKGIREVRVKKRRMKTGATAGGWNRRGEGILGRGEFRR